MPPENGSARQPTSLVTLRPPGAPARTCHAAGHGPQAGWRAGRGQPPSSRSRLREPIHVWPPTGAHSWSGAQGRCGPGRLRRAVRPLVRPRGSRPASAAPSSISALRSSSSAIPLGRYDRVCRQPSAPRPATAGRRGITGRGLSDQVEYSTESSLGRAGGPGSAAPPAPVRPAAPGDRAGGGRAACRRLLDDVSRDAAASAARVCRGRRASPRVRRGAGSWPP